MIEDFTPKGILEYTLKQYDPSTGKIKPPVDSKDWYYIKYFAGGLEQEANG